MEEKNKNIEEQFYSKPTNVELKQQKLMQSRDVLLICYKL